MFNLFCVDLSEVQDSDPCLIFISHAYVSFPCHVPVSHYHVLLQVKDEEDILSQSAFDELEEKLKEK